VSYCPRSSLPAKVLAWLTGRLAHLTCSNRFGTCAAHLRVRWGGHPDLGRGVVTRTSGGAVIPAFSRVAGHPGPDGVCRWSVRLAARSPSTAARNRNNPSTTWRR